MDCQSIWLLKIFDVPFPNTAPMYLSLVSATSPLAWMTSSKPSRSETPQPPPSNTSPGSQIEIEVASDPGIEALWLIPPNTTYTLSGDIILGPGIPCVPLIPLVPLNPLRLLWALYSLFALWAPVAPVAPVVTLVEPCVPVLLSLLTSFLSSFLSSNLLNLQNSTELTKKPSNGVSYIHIFCRRWGIGYNYHRHSSPEPLLYLKNHCSG